jgi:hypothetical protein
MKREEQKETYHPQKENWNRLRSPNLERKIYHPKQETLFSVREQCTGDQCLFAVRWIFFALFVFWWVK